MYGQRPDDVLSRHAEETAADCIFLVADRLGHHQGTNESVVLSKVVQSVVLGAPCSVAVVRPRILTHLDPAA
jgi:nucleotide-binding universal stress UspA family protein